MEYFVLVTKLSAYILLSVLNFDLAYHVSSECRKSNVYRLPYCFTIINSTLYSTYLTPTLPKHKPPKKFHKDVIIPEIKPGYNDYSSICTKEISQD